MSGCAENELFALRVLGDSMEPEFKEGQVVVVEPGQHLQSGCFVIARHEGEYLLRRLVQEDSQWQLEPLNDRYPTLAVSGPAAIRGRVTQRAGRRRKERKSYC
jgi:SOS-response transcriptional repressor LexA